MISLRGVTAGVLIAAASLTAAPPPSIDGSLDDPFWSSDARVWTATDPRMPSDAARFLLGFDQRYLYFAAEVVDAEVLGNRRGRKDRVEEDDGVALFLDFGNGAATERTARTWHYAFSAAGGVDWSRGTAEGDSGNYPGHESPASWTSRLQWSVRLKPGTSINNPATADTGYMVEARIPVEELENNLRPDATVGVNLVAFCRAGGKPTADAILSPLPGMSAGAMHNPSRWQRIRLDWQAPLPVRGLVRDLPVWLGHRDPLGHWQQYQNAENDPQGAWMNRAAWSRELNWMEAQQLNALLFEHPCPLAALLPGPPPARPDYLDESLRARHQEQFRWLLAEARQQGVSIYLTLGRVPDESAAATRPSPGTSRPGNAGLPNLGEVAAALLRAYPELAGLAVTTNQLADPSLATSISQAAASTRPADRAGHPRLLVQVASAELDRLPQLPAAGPGVVPLVEAFGAQWVTPDVSPAAERIVIAAGCARPDGRGPVVSVLALGGPGTALNGLFWGDPDWMRLAAIELRRKGLNGMFLRAPPDQPRLAAEAWGAYAMTAGEAFAPARWQKRLDEQFAIGSHAGQLLEAVQHGSAVLPGLMTLLYDDSPYFMPQFGLTLAHCVGLPTVSTHASGRGAASPASAPAEPPADSAALLPCVRHVATVRDAVAGRAPRGAVTPDQVAAEIGRRAAACRALLTGLRRAKPDAEMEATGLRELLDRLELSAGLGRHYEHRIRAALAWEQFRTQRATSADAAREVQLSVRSWEDLLPVAQRLYPNPVPRWELQLVSAPPWTVQQIAAGYWPNEGHWRASLSVLELESELFRRRLGEDGILAALPAWDEIHPVSPERLMPLGKANFDSGGASWLRMGPGVAVVEDPQLAIAGKSLSADTRGLGEGWHLVLASNPSATLPAGEPLQISFVYRVMSRGLRAEPFRAGVRAVGGGEVLGDHPQWGAPADHKATRVIQVPPLPTGAHELVIEIEGEAFLIIDQLSIDRIKPPG